jgi:hypothetical protein
LKIVQNCSRHFLAPTCVAIALVVGSGASALAFDCLTSKPAGARGYWHSQPVAGKTCWFGADWRSFLAKSKAQTEPAAAQAEPMPAAKPAPMAKSEPKSEPQPQAEATPAPAETADAEGVQDPPGLRQATPSEAAALINSISLDFEPATPVASKPAKSAPPAAKSAPQAAPDAQAQSHNTGDWLITFGELAILGGVLATLIRLFRRRRAMKAQPAQPQLMPMSLRFAPPLQPGIGADDQLAPLQAPWATAPRSRQRETV